MVVLEWPDRGSVSVLCGKAAANGSDTVAGPNNDSLGITGRVGRGFGATLLSGGRGSGRSGSTGREARAAAIRQVRQTVPGGGPVRSRGRCGTPPARRGSTARSRREGKVFPHRIRHRKANAPHGARSCVGHRLYLLWIAAEIPHQHLPRLRQRLGKVQLPIFVRAERDAELPRQLLHGQPLLQSLRPNMVNEPSRCLVMIRPQPPPSLFPPPGDYNSPLTKSQQLPPA